MTTTIVLPNFITDIRSSLPKTADWKKRSIKHIKGVVIHQTCGLDSDTPLAINQYHIGYNPIDKSYGNANHLGPNGAPKICYTFVIDREGQIYFCNDFEDITWAQNNVKMPCGENTLFVSVALIGNFNYQPNQNYGQPTDDQLVSLDMLWRWLKSQFNLVDSDLFGHSDFGKQCCPGLKVCEYIELIRRESYSLTIQDWQQALIANNYMESKHVVYGNWDNLCRESLANYQKDHFNLPFLVDGSFNRLTEWLLFRSLRK